MDERKIKVLVVDDESDFRQLMTIWLESKGYYVIGASDGNSAIQFVKERNPDVVFLDLYMPVMDGIEVLRKIREFNKEIPVIIISAYTYDKKLKEAKELGVAGVVNKCKDFTEGLFLLESALKAYKKSDAQE